MRSKWIIASSLALIGSACAWAQTAPPLKVAVIDMQAALIQTKEGQKAATELKAKFSPKEQEFQKRQQELQAKQDQYRKTENTISDEQRRTHSRSRSRS